MEHNNLGVFFEFLRDTLKDPSVLETEMGKLLWVKDLESAISITGGTDYEISGWSTKLGNPVLYRIKKEWFFGPEGDSDYRIIHQQ